MCYKQKCKVVSLNLAHSVVTDTIKVHLHSVLVHQQSLRPNVNSLDQLALAVASYRADSQLALAPPKLNRSNAMAKVGW